jgi:hypothetical protein
MAPAPGSTVPIVRLWSLPVTELFAFVVARTAETASAAAGRGDRLAERFHLTSLTIVDAMRRDFEEDPREAGELVRFLCRTAARWSGHPDFRHHWLLEAR